MSTPAPIAYSFTSTPIGHARLGRIETSHGRIDTPQFMPVGTQGTVKALTPGDLHAAGAQMILGNTYHLNLRPTAERIARLGGLHRFMAWDGPILTDSGGFQVFSLADLRRVDDEGVTFTSHLDGSTHRLTPERAMEIQALLGSDVAMALDQLVDPGAGSGTVADAMERTHRWAERSLAARGRPDQAVFGIVQGGIDPELRRASVTAVRALPFDGIAVGGLSVGESKAELTAALDVVADALGTTRDRATSWASARRPTSSAPWSAGSTCSIASSPPASPAPGKSGPMRAASTCGTPRSSTTRHRSTPGARAKRVGSTRGRISRTSSARGSSSPTGSRRSIT